MIAPTTPTMTEAVASVFDSYPSEIRFKLLALRKMIFEVAARTNGVGPITETLKWGEPAYLTEESKSGSTIRIGWKPSDPENYSIYFNCRTSLVENFRFMFPDDLSFAGNRAIVFGAADALPVDSVTSCLAMALTYHRTKRRAASS